MLLHANSSFVMFGDPAVLDRARVGIRRRLAAAGAH